MVQQEVGGEAGCCGSSRGLLFHTWIVLRGPGGGGITFLNAWKPREGIPLSVEMTSFPRKVRGPHELRGFCLIPAIYHYYNAIG